MHSVDLETWPRRKQFRFFNAFDHPHFNMCTNVDLTAFHPVVIQHGISFTVAIVYVLARAANAIPEFRYRIRAGEVIEHEVVHPSVTILVEEDLFSFCTIGYVEEFSEFAARTTERIAYVKEHPIVEDEPGQDDLLYMTSIPWVSFTSFMHPIHFNPVDSTPLFAWGKFFKESEILKMPLSVQGHHGLMDGIHMGKFYAKVQEDLCHPDFIQR